MLTEAIRLSSWIGQFSKTISPFRGSKSRKESGLDPREYEQVRGKAIGLKSRPAEWWKAIDESMEVYTSPEEKNSWFVTRPLREVLLFDEIVGSGYHHALHGSVPGLLTGLGLMLTFIAILQALAGVSYNPANLSEPVKGMDTLISGLSGKFLSSIVALGLSVLFTVIERGTSRRLRRNYESLLDSCAAVFPHLSPSRILLDIQRFASKQTVSISHISSEVVDRFVGAFKTQVSPALAEGMALQLQNEFRPTMQQMNNTLSELREAIVSLESQKQESIAGELRGLLESLETSMVNTLGKMGSDFHEALTGAANREFNNVQGTLEGTRQMLSEMNSQFARMQEAFAGIINQAENATKEQLSTGRQQTDALTAVMHSLIGKLQQSADENVGAIRNQLTLVVSDLSEKVGGLSKDLLTAAQAATIQSQASAQTVIEQAGTWSESTARRLEALVNAIEARSHDFEQAGRTLLAANGALGDTIEKNSRVLQEAAKASTNIQAYSEALLAQTGAMKNLHLQQSETAGKLQRASASIVTAFSQHDQYLQQYRRIFEEYKAVFDTLDGRLAHTLDTIHKGLQQYASAIEHNFREVVKTTNETLPQIAGTLNGQIAELENQLEELSSVLSKGVERLSARAR
jgi:Mg2+ and Co2+ transporter CorA